jgi:hypothetical protein
MLIAIAVLFALYISSPKKENTNKNRITKLQKLQKPQTTPQNKPNPQKTNNTQNPNCPHSFGYLRTQKNKNIPQECTCCDILVKCLISNDE